MANKDESFPWMKFYPSDHLSDPKLKICSLEAQGLWVQMLCWMHEANRYGYLEIEDKQITSTQLAKLSGESENRILKLLQELEDNGVYSKTRSGVIYSRRMLKDFKKRQTNRENGKKGGNPNLRYKRENSKAVKPQLKGKDKGGNKTQSPDTRNQRPKTLVSGSKPIWRKKICQLVGADNYNAWFKNVEFEGGVIICQSNFFADHLRGNFERELKSALGIESLEFCIQRNRGG